MRLPESPTLKTDSTPRPHLVISAILWSPRKSMRDANVTPPGKLGLLKKVLCQCIAPEPSTRLCTVSSTSSPPCGTGAPNSL